MPSGRTSRDVRVVGVLVLLVTLIVTGGCQRDRAASAGPDGGPSGGPSGGAGQPTLATDVAAVLRQPWQPPGPGVPDRGIRRLDVEFPATTETQVAGGEWSGRKVLWVISDDYDGPALIRGLRLDGPGTVGGSGPPTVPSPSCSCRPADRTTSSPVAGGTGHPPRPACARPGATHGTSTGWPSATRSSSRSEACLGRAQTARLAPRADRLGLGGGRSGLGHAGPAAPPPGPSGLSRLVARGRIRHHGVDGHPDRRRGGRLTAERNAATGPDPGAGACGGGGSLRRAVPVRTA